ncbi:albusnodin/ikarugamycin family macrolactam cyclase [Nonomuraea cavernae]|uniref:albusnodin/ikarugamycin family macrolactam cyclase n=1 Tax=Nonomuraea cavernae TaxID=2045107 RepID=UPI0033EA32CD
MNRRSSSIWDASGLSSAATPPAATPTPIRSITGERSLPGFLVHLRDGRLSDDPDLPGLPVWSGIEGVRAYGLWPRGQLSTATYGSARLLVAGHCLASQEEIAARLAAAIDGVSPDLLTELPGAYACVLVERDRIQMYSDLGGQFPFYLAARGGGWLVSSHARLHGRELDPPAAAVDIVCPHVLPLTEGRSLLRGVREVGGGQVISAASGGVEVRRYAPRLPERVTDPAEGARALRSALVEAVRLRCRSGVVTSDLSGGVDSTALTLLAARLSPEAVDAVVYHHPSAPADDLAQAVRVASADRRIRLATVRGTPDTLPYQRLDQAWADRPAPGALAHRRAMLRLRWAASHGSGAHLTGEGADALLHPSPAYLADLVKAGSVARLVKDSAALAQLRKVAPGGLMSRAARLARTSPAMALRQLGRSLNGPPRGAGSPADAVSWWSVSGEAIGWLAPRVRSDLADIATDPATRRAMPEGVGPADHAALAELRSAAHAQQYLRELGAEAGVAVHAPYLDRAVIRSCLAVPAVLRAERGRFKPLLVAALRDLVPNDALSRTTKGAYQAEEYLGARRARREISALLADSRLVDLGVVDPRAVAVTVTRLFHGAPVPLGSFGRLLALETWLRDT